MKLGGRAAHDHRRGVAVALLLFYRLGLSPALERMRTLDRLVATKERELHQMKTLQETYVAQKRLMEDVSRSLAQRGPDFAIFSFLEDLANKTGIKDNIKSMTPASPPQVSCSASRPLKCGSKASRCNN